MGRASGADLQAAPGALGAALLDQAVIAGIGNVYRAEALFASGLHPSRPAASLTRAEFDRLWATVREMMAHAVDEGRIVTVDPPMAFLAHGDHAALDEPEPAPTR